MFIFEDIHRKKYDSRLFFDLFNHGNMFDGFWTGPQDDKSLKDKIMKRDLRRGR